MNIKNVMMMAAMMPAFALAETNSNCAPASVEANDTTIRVNDQNIVIRQETVSQFLRNIKFPF